MTQSDYQYFQGICDGVLMSHDARSCVAETAAEGQQVDINHMAPAATLSGCQCWFLSKACWGMT